MRTTTPSSRPCALRWAALLMFASGCAVPDKGGTWPDPPPPTLATPLGVDESASDEPAPESASDEPAPKPAAELAPEPAAAGTASGAPALPAAADTPAPEDGPTNPPPVNGEPPSST